MYELFLPKHKKINKPAHVLQRLEVWKLSPLTHTPAVLWFRLHADGYLERPGRGKEALHFGDTDIRTVDLEVCCRFWAFF